MVIIHGGGLGSAFLTAHGTRGAVYLTHDALIHRDDDQWMWRGMKLICSLVSFGVLSQLGFGRVRHSQSSNADFDPPTQLRR